jgi:hypothetical protein
VSYFFILGASDPEMAQVERRLAGNFPYALALRDGHRVHPANAYAATDVLRILADSEDESEDVRRFTPVFVECRLVEDCPLHAALGTYVVVDHHHEGDPGFGMPPERYLEGSSLGQVLALLGMEPGYRDRLIAAADHCPGAAYAGQCPGVDPEDLAEFRALERLAWLTARPEYAPERRALCGDLSLRGINRVYARTRNLVLSAPYIDLGGYAVRDLRPYGVVPELPEVLARMGECALYRFPGKRVKVGIIGGGLGTASGRGPIDAFLAVAAEQFNLVNLYGDPTRGYAGGYET